ARRPRHPDRACQLSVGQYHAAGDGTQRLPDPALKWASLDIEGPGVRAVEVAIENGADPWQDVRDGHAVLDNRGPGLRAAEAVEARHWVVLVHQVESGDTSLSQSHEGEPHGRRAAAVPDRPPGARRP